MFSTLALAILIGQPVKDKELREPDLDAYLAKHDPLIAKAVKPDPKDTALQKLQKERCRERALAVARIKEVVAMGKWDSSYFTDYIKLQTVLWENLAEVLDAPPDKLKCYQLRLDAMKECEEFMRTRVLAGTDTHQNLNIAKANRIDVEIDLLKMKEAIEKAGKK